MNEKNENELMKEIELLKAENKKLKSRKKYGIVWDEEKELEKIVIECMKKIPIFNDVKDREILSDGEESMNLLIEGDNYQALQVLNYTHNGKIDLIYIDPPYNTGAKDWKYNNNFVDENDTYRHSKWLSMMKKRLVLTKNLLSSNGILIITIDDNELFHLGALLEELFSEYDLFIITIEHNKRGRRGKNFAKTNEWAIYLVPKGRELIAEEKSDTMIGGETRNLRRTGSGSKRHERPRKFYPIWVDKKTFEVVKTGNPLPLEATWEIEEEDDLISIWPIDENGDEKNWHYGVDRTKKCIIDGTLEAREQDYGIQVYYTLRKKESKKYKTVWTGQIYDASTYGSVLLTEILGTSNDFDYPKSLYAVLECLKTAVIEKKDAIILDYFAGSGTTGHAVLKLNNEDGGKRKFILCTNNEVSIKDKKRLLEMGINPGDDQYEAEGICQKICYPRIKNVMKGYDYKGTEKEVIWEKKIGVNELKKGEEIYDESEQIKKEEKEKDSDCKITRSMSNKEGYIQLIKEKKIDGKKEGLGGNLKYFKTDVIDVDDVYSISDEKKIELTYKAGEMIAIREDVFNEIEKNDWWQIFRNKNITVAIYFREDQSQLKKLFEIIKDNTSIVYLFSWGKNELKAEEYGYYNIELRDIPQPIIEVYKGINRLNEV